jgi:tripeptide aminopeptidase
MLMVKHDSCRPGRRAVLEAGGSFATTRAARQRPTGVDPSLESAAPTASAQSGWDKSGPSRNADGIWSSVGGQALRATPTARRHAGTMLALLLTLVGRPLLAQPAATDVGAQLLRDPAAARALAAVGRLEPWVLEQQVALCEVPAPPFAEQERAAHYQQAFLALGLERVRIDAAGNVLGVRRGRQPRPHVVFSAHLDTVFPEGTDVTVRREGALLKGPGIGDDCRGLAVVLGVARAMGEAAVETEGTITFVGTVGEEGLGDLRGVKHLFAEELAGTVDHFVSVDGTGLGIVSGGVGSVRYRATFSGPGGHSYGAFGMANPLHALGRAIATVADLRVPTRPKTTFSVGRVGGGTSVNAIAFEGWMEVDLRSEDSDALRALDQQFRDAVTHAVAAENARWSNPVTVKVSLEVVGNRPAGRTADTAPIVRAAISVTRALGHPVSLTSSSTDANVPMSQGISAITIGGGGAGQGAHSLDEQFDTRTSVDGTRRALLLALALAAP